MKKNYAILNVRGVIALILLVSMGVSNSMAQDVVHDPSAIIKGDDDRYYFFATGDGSHSLYAESADNVHFENRVREADPIAKDNYPTWIDTYISGFDGTFWAPGVIYMEGYYYLYYSASQFGTSYSTIGVTRTASLANPTWEDQGMVVYSSGGRSEINAIDPAMFKDEDGKVWMSYGSWHGGIGVVEIDQTTGKTTGSVTHVAGGNHEGYEAPYILKNNGYYYLFINRGTCCNGVNSSYYVEVSRATSITGPYSGVRTFIENDNGKYIGPGHIGYGEGTLSFHYYDAFSNGFPRLYTTTLSFENDWPVIPTLVEYAYPSGTYVMTAVHSGKALGFDTTSPGDGTNLAQWVKTSDEKQQFAIEQVSGKWHALKPVLNTGIAVDVYNCSADDGANLNFWSYFANDCQLFSFYDEGNGRYRIINKNSKKCLDVLNGSHNDGENITQYGCWEGYTNQMFTLEKVATSVVTDALGEKFGFALVPNPASDKVSIQVTGEELMNCPFKIISLQGKVLYQSVIEAEITSVDESLPQGIYIVVVEKEFGVLTEKLIVK